MLKETNNGFERKFKIVVWKKSGNGIVKDMFKSIVKGRSDIEFERAHIDFYNNIKERFFKETSQSKFKGHLNIEC